MKNIRNLYLAVFVITYILGMCFTSCDHIAYKLGYEKAYPKVQQTDKKDYTLNNQVQNSTESYKYSESNATQSQYYQKENDFMVAVLNNPQFNLYDFIKISGLHERNTQFLTEAQYWNTKYIKNKCVEMGINDFHRIYNKVRTAWCIFKEIQDTDVSYDGMGKYFYNYGDWDITKPSNCPYPELKHKLSIVPLQLK